MSDQGKKKRGENVRVIAIAGASMLLQALFTREGFLIAHAGETSSSQSESLSPATLTLADATIVEPLARYATGQLSAETVWHDLADNNSGLYLFAR